MMKILTGKIDRNFLIVVNLLIILIVEFVGHGQYFAQTGLIHLLTVFYLFFLLINIFRGQALGDSVLKSFLRIQMVALLFITSTHLIEYFAHNITALDKDLCDLYVIASYILWLIMIIFSSDYIQHIKESTKNKINSFPKLIGSITITIFSIIIFLQLGNSYIHSITPALTFIILLIAGSLAIWKLTQMSQVMPIYKHFTENTISAIFLIIIASMLEISEAQNLLSITAISDVQIEYLAHFSVYLALSFLLIGFNSLMNPSGIYQDL